MNILKKQIFVFAVVFVLSLGVTPMTAEELPAAMLFEQELLEGGDLRMTIIDDFNGDGIFDVGAFNDDGTISVFTANGDGTFAEEAIYNAEDLPLLTDDTNAPVVLAADSIVDSSKTLTALQSTTESAIAISAISPPYITGSLVGWGEQVPPNGELVDVVAIAAGSNHSLALKSDGSIVGWGWNRYGQSIVPSGNDYLAIAAGSNHSLALKSDGSIVGWGMNFHGQSTPPAGNDFVAIAAYWNYSLALKSDGSIMAWGNTGSAPAGNDFVAIAAGGRHSLALKSDGSIVGWGSNSSGQATPPGGTDFVAIAAGWNHSLALKSDGSIVGWGYNGYGQATPPVGNDYVAIAAGQYHGLAIKADGSIVGWGAGEPGQNHGPHYGQATSPSGNDFVAIAAGNYHSLALKSDGSIAAWGGSQFGQATPPAGNDFVAIAAGGYHDLALKSDGSIVGWGRNFLDQATPPAGYDFVTIAAGFYHSLALKSDGSIVGWGSNNFGESTAPAGNGFVAIAAGYYYSLALKSDGSIVGWGRDSDGQATPLDGNDFVTIAAGNVHGLAIKADGSIVAWGGNDYGQATPPGGTDFVAIAAGSHHSLALKSDGSLAAWGTSSLGLSTAPEGNDFVAIAAGRAHSLALKSDGSIVGWGSNRWGGESTAPAGNDFIAIAAGLHHSLAIKAETSDFQVTSEDITFVPDSPVEPGTIIVISAEVHNVGPEDANSFVVRFFNGDPDSGGIQIGGDQEITTLAGRASEVVSVAFTTSPELQSYEIFVLADATFQIEERNEANNKAFRILTAGSDLDLTSSDISFSAQVAGEVRITAEVHNVGTGNVDEQIEVAFYNGDPETGGAYIGDATIIGGIAEGLSEIAEIVEWSNPPLGTYNIYVVVDPEGEIIETTKANNKAFNILSATLDLKLTSEDISFNPEPAMLGQQIEISASIHNSGFLACEEFLVKLYDGDPDAGGTELGAEIVEGIVGLGSVQVSILSAFTSRGKHEIYVVADANNEVEETNEDNNLASNSLYVQYDTIQEAIDAASPGDTVYIGPRTYNENVLINKSITLIGAGSATTIIDGGGTDDVVLVTADNVTIKGFTVQNSIGDGSGIHLRATGASVSENIITQCYYGIFCDYSSGSYIAHNTVTANSYGIYCEYASGDAIRRNTITNNTLYGAKSYNSSLANCFNWNYFSGNPIGYSYDPEVPVGPLLFGGNVLQDNEISIEVKDTSASDLEFSDNTIVGSDIGILCENANPLIKDNALSSNETAIYLVNSSSPTIEENTISENTTGIVHDESSEPVLEDNNMVGNVEDVTTIPVANAGLDQTVEADTLGGAWVTLDGSGSYDPDGDALTYEWMWNNESATGVEPMIFLPLGTTTITLIVNDGTVDSAPDTVDITVVDTTQPVITLNGDATMTLECGVDSYTEEGATAMDICDPDVPVVIGGDTVDTSTCGTYVVTYDATDDSGNSAEQVTRTVIVEDTIPPEFALSVTPDTLWPPNHKMVLITPSWEVSDNCDESVDVTLVSITMNEGEETNTYDPLYDNTLGDGHTIDDIQVDSDGIWLRAERSGTGDGRIYTITYQAVDDSGNVTVQSATVTVPHDQG